jgi:putative ADP-ribosyl-[dinitrogen reductase] hydrolase
MWNFALRHRITILTILILLLIKVIWVTCSCWGNGSLDDEKDDLLQRRNYLVDKIMVEPLQLLNEMPGGIGLQFQGEWALYSCSMLAESLSNMAELYPETKDDAVATIDSLIQIVKSPELRLYDKLRWDEDPLESLEGDKSHVSYLSHLAWMIGNYRRIGGDNKYKQLHDSVCEAMNRRIQQSPLLNIPTYPNEPIYVPDMMVAIVALSDYARLNDCKYSSTVKAWICRSKTEWLDNKTGLLVSFLDDNGMRDTPVKGSYAALNCYYLTKIDAEFANEQYDKLKIHFRQSFPATGIREYHDHSCWLGMDIDAGPIILNLSPSGTAFAIGAATYFNDIKFRNSLLKTAEIAGHTVKWNNKRHYLLGDIALVGEVITLAMRTNYRINNLRYCR